MTISSQVETIKKSIFGNTMNRINKIKKLLQFFLPLFLLLGVAGFGDEGAVTFTNKGNYTTSMTPQKVKKVGNYTYVANGANGVAIFSDNGEALTLVKSQPIDTNANIKDLAIDGNFIYALSSTKVYVLDTNLSVMGTLALSGILNSIEAKGTTLYIANGTEGLAIIDASDSSNPIQANRLSTTDAKKIVRNGDALYLADGWGGLKVISIVNSLSPVVVHSEGGETYTDIAFDTTKLFASTGTIIQSYDITNSFLPVKKQLFNPSKTITTLFSYDSNLYIGNSDGIFAYSTVNMDLLAPSGNFTDIRVITGLFVSSGYGYMTTVASLNLAVFDSDFADNLTTSQDSTPFSTFPKTLEGTLPLGEGDVDFIKVDLPNFGIFSLSFNTKIENLTVKILGDQNETISETNNTAEAISRFSTSLNKGVYFIQIASDTNSSGTYKISMSLANDDFSDSIDGSLLISDREKIFANISSEADKDVFKLFIPQSGTLTVKSADSFLKARVLTNTKGATPLGDGIGEIASGINFTIPSSGYYFVELSGEGGKQNYSFETSFIKNPSSIYRDDDKPQLKKLLETNSSIYGESLVLTPEYLFAGTNGNILRINKDTLETLQVYSAITSTTALSIKDMVVLGEYLYYAIDTQGIGIAKIGSNGILSEVKKGFAVDGGVAVNKIIVDGDFLYTFSGTKLYKINIATKTTPTLTATYEMGTTIYDIDIKYSTWNRDGEVIKTRNGYIYLATDSGLKVFGIDDVALVTTYNSETSPFSKIKIYDNRAYITNGITMGIYDISVPVYASKLGTYNTNGSNPIENIVTTKERAYLSPYLEVVNIENEKNPTFINRLADNVTQKEMVLLEGIAYSIATNSKLALYEVENDYTNKPLSLNATIKGNISSNVKKYTGISADVDLFVLNTTQSGRLDINLTATSGIDLNTTLGVAITNKSFSLNISPSDSNKTISVSGSEGNYTLQTTFVPDDVSDEITSATPLVFDTNGVVSKNGNLLSTGTDKDYFEITLDRRGELTIDLNGTMDAKVTLYDTDKKTIYNRDYNTIDGNVTYKIDTTLNAGVYYLLVASESNSSNSGEYSIRVTFTPNDDFVLNGKVAYDQLVYGDRFIYVVKDNRLNIYSHLLQKISQKESYFDTGRMCSKPVIAGDYMYYNLNKFDPNSTDPCDKTQYTLSNGGYMKYNLNVGEDEYNEIHSKSYQVYQEANMVLEYDQSTDGMIDFDRIDENTLVGIDNGGALKLYDISNKTTMPITKDRETLPKSVNVLTEGNYLYSYDSNYNMLYIYDVTNKTRPTIEGEVFVNISSNYYGNDMVLSGNYLYMANSNGLIRVVDVSNKKAPRVVFENGLTETMTYDGGYYNQSGQWISQPYTYQNSIYDTVYDLELVGSDLYAKINGGFYIINISTRDQPVVSGKYRMDSYSYYSQSSIKVKDNIAYFTDNGLIHRANVSDKTNPQYLGSSYEGYSATLLALGDGDSIYLSSSYNGNSVFKTTLIAIRDNNQSAVSTYTSPYYYYNSPTQLEYKNNKLYVVENSNSVTIYDENLTTKTTKSSLPSTPQDIFVTDSNIFVSYDSNGFGVYDTNLTTLLNSDGYGYNGTINNFRSILAHGNILYVANEDYYNSAGLKIYEVNSAKTDIEYKGYLAIKDTNNNNVTINKIAKSGNYLYLYNTNFIGKYDITDPLVPSRIATLSTTNKSYTKMLINGEYGYLANGSSIEIVNLSTMTIVSHSLSFYVGTIQAIAIKGTTLYLGGGDNGIAELNVTSPTSPTLIKTFTPKDYWSVRSLAVDRDALYVGTSNTLIKYDITSPADPIIKEIATQQNGYYDYYTNQYIQNGYYGDTYSFATEDFKLYDGKLYGRSYNSEIKVVDLNGSFLMPYTTTIERLNILYADEKYLYEYGTRLKDKFDNPINQSALSRVLNTQDNYNAQSNGQYDIAGVTILRSYGETMFIAIDKKLQIVSFDGNGKPIIHTEIAFDRTIDQLEVLGEKKALYIHTQGTSFVKVYNIADSANIEKIQEYYTNESINSIYFKHNKVYMASRDYGIKIAYTDDSGKLIEDRDFENIGVKVDDAYSSDNSTFNYTAEDAAGKRKLNVFVLKDELVDGVSDSVYTKGDANNPPKEGCFIATAAYGSYFEKHVKVLRDFRDRYLKTNPIGLAFVDLYYTYSPAIADMIAQSEIAKGVIRIILTPIVYCIEYPLYGVLLIGLLFGIRREYRKSKTRGLVA